MKIMTKDGEDVTNSASRGCKTKEQRDHAHLMRIMKACDACRRKKIRCDPSHKKRTASQAQTPPKPKPAKRARKSAAAEPPVESPAFSPDFQASGASFPFDTTAALPSVDLFTEPFEETWDQFIQFDDEPAVLPDYDYDFFFDPEGHFTRAPYLLYRLLSHSLLRLLDLPGISIAANYLPRSTSRSNPAIPQPRWPWY